LFSSREKDWGPFRAGGPGGGTCTKKHVANGEKAKGTQRNHVKIEGKGEKRGHIKTEEAKGIIQHPTKQDERSARRPEFKKKGDLGRSGWASKDGNREKRGKKKHRGAVEENGRLNGLLASLSANRKRSCCIQSNKRRVVQTGTSKKGKGRSGRKRKGRMKRRKIQAYQSDWKKKFHELNDKKHRYLWEKELRGEAKENQRKRVRGIGTHTQQL